MPPEAGDGFDAAAGTELAELRVEVGRLVRLVDDDLVGDAPPELERNPGLRDRLDPVGGASEHVPGGIGTRRSADLEAREELQSASAGRDREIVVASIEVRDRVEGDGAGEQPWMLPEQEEGLLAAHAPTERVDPSPVEAEPGQRALGDLRHTREVGDLSAPTPRVKRQASAHAARTDDHEAPAGR